MFKEHSVPYNVTVHVDRVLPAPSQIWSHSSVDSAISWVDSTVGSNLPGWRARIRKGLSATTDYSGSLRSNFSVGGSSAHVHWNDTISQNFQETFSGLCPVPLANDPLPSNLPSPNSIALAGFYKTLRSRKTPFTGLIFLAELKKSLVMMKSPMSGIKQLTELHFGRLKKGARLSRSDRIKLLSDSWLELQFGWLPLIKDLGDMGKAFNRQLAKTRLSSPVKFVAGTSAQDPSISFGTTTFGSKIYVNMFRRSIGTWDIRYKGAWKATVSGTAFDADILDKFGLITSEFIPTAWEIVPWSFLVDYFSNVGAVIESHYLARQDLAWWQRTSRTVSSSTYWAEIDLVRLTATFPCLAYTCGLDSFGSEFGTSESTTVQFVRDVPILEPLALEFSMSLTATKWLNILALSAARRRLVPYY